MRIFSRSSRGDAAPARLRILCFAHAGASSAMFRTWPEFLPPGLELACPSLPGRDARAAELPLADMQALVSLLAEDLLPLPAVPYCLFGHSLGAFVAFELARELARRRAPPPLHLFVAAQRAPALPHPQPPIYELPDAAFLDGVQRRHEALPPALLADAAMRAFLTRLLRADFTLVEAYHHGAREPLSCGITVFGGREDTAVAPSLLADWAEETTADCKVVLLPGGHFFFRSHPAAFFGEFSLRLASAMPGGSPR